MARTTDRPRRPHNLPSLRGRDTRTIPAANPRVSSAAIGRDPRARVMMRLLLLLGGSHHALPRHHTRCGRRTWLDHCRRFQAARAMARGEQGRRAVPGPGCRRRHPVGRLAVGRGRDQSQRRGAVADRKPTTTATESTVAQRWQSDAAAPLATTATTATAAATAASAATASAATAASATAASAAPDPHAVTGYAVRACFRMAASTLAKSATDSGMAAEPRASTAQASSGRPASARTTARLL